MKHAGGRPPTPTALKVLRGNPGKRPLNRTEPTLEIADPERPVHLDEVACQEWDRLVPILKRMRILTEADRIALGNLCQIYSTQIQAQQQLAKAGILYQSKSGYIQQSPLFAIIARCIDIVGRLSGEFGLTPSARVRVHAAPEKNDAYDEWDELKRMKECP